MWFSCGGSRKRAPRHVEIDPHRTPPSTLTSFPGPRGVVFSTPSSHDSVSEKTRKGIRCRSMVIAEAIPIAPRFSFLGSFALITKTPLVFSWGNLCGGMSQDFVLHRRNPRNILVCKISSELLYLGVTVVNSRFELYREILCADWNLVAFSSLFHQAGKLLYFSLWSSSALYEFVKIWTPSDVWTWS